MFHVDLSHVLSTPRCPLPIGRDRYDYGMCASGSEIHPHYTRLKYGQLNNTENVLFTCNAQVKLSDREHRLIRAGLIFGSQRGFAHTQRVHKRLPEGHHMHGLLLEKCLSPTWNTWNLASPLYNAMTDLKLEIC